MLNYTKFHCALKKKSLLPIQMAVIRFTGLLSPVAQLAQVCLMKNLGSFFFLLLTNLFDIHVAPLMFALLSLSSPTQSTIYRFNFSVTHLEIRGILVLKL